MTCAFFPYLYRSYYCTFPSVICCGPCSTLFPYTTLFRSVPRTWYEGLNWLGAQPSGRVLSMPGVGLFVPAYSPDTVYVGHYDETFDYVNKTQTTLELLTGKADIVHFDATNHLTHEIWSAA